MWTVCPKCGHDKVDPEEGCIPCQFKQENVRRSAERAEIRRRVRAERRFKAVYVDDHFLLSILTGKLRFCLQNTPLDVEFVAASYDFHRQAVGIIVQSSQWEPVPTGGIVPLLDGGGGRLFAPLPFEEQAKRIEKVVNRHHELLLGMGASREAFHTQLVDTLKELNGETTRS